MSDEKLKSDLQVYFTEKAGLEPLNSMVTRENIRDVSSNLRELTYEEYTILIDAYNGKKPVSIAKELGIPIRRVYNVLYRARQKIRYE